MSHSPIFVGTFADGVKTQMTTWHDPTAKSLDLGRAIRLSKAAYGSRTKKQPPPLSEGHFERDGVVLQTYTADELNVADGGKP
jgi:hypothetical protein